MPVESKCPALTRELELNGFLKVDGSNPFQSDSSGGSSDIILIAGGPGSGKTTFAARLASHYAMMFRAGQGKPVRLLSCDRYKVGAFQHLDRFASIIDVTVDKVQTSSEFSDRVNDEESSVIIADTTAISGKTDFEQFITPYLLTGGGHVNLLLVLSVLVKPEINHRLFRLFDGYDFQIVLTMCDCLLPNEIHNEIWQYSDYNLDLISAGSDLPGTLYKRRKKQN